MSEVLNEDQFSKLMDALDIEKPCPEALHQLMASWHRKMTSKLSWMVDFYTHLLLVKINVKLFANSVYISIYWWDWLDCFLYLSWSVDFFCFSSEKIFIHPVAISVTKPGSYRISRWRHFQAELPEFPFGPQGVFFPGKRGNGVDGEGTLWRACWVVLGFRSKLIAPKWIMFEVFWCFC